MFYNSITSCPSDNFVNHRQKIKVGIAGNYAIVPTLTENCIRFSSDLQPKNKIKLDKSGTGEILQKVQHKRSMLESINSLFYKYRNSTQLQFLTFTTEMGTPDEHFVKSMQAFFKYFIKTKLLSDYIYNFERQKNKTLHSHMIVKMPSKKQVTDFINKNRLLRNKEYNGKKITTFYQLLRFKFEEIIGTDKHLHMHFLTIQGDNVINENGGTVASLNYYLTKYMIKTNDLQCSCLKYSFRCSKSIKKVDAIYLEKKDIISMKHVYYYKDNIKDFGKLEMNKSLFNLFQKHDYDQQNKVNDSIRYFEGELKKLLPKLENKHNNENKTVLDLKKNHPTFTLLELNFEPQNEIKQHYT